MMMLLLFDSISKIYTFNYTPTIENIYKVDKSKIVYLHGLIHEHSDKQNLVLGVSEVSENMKVNKAYDFTKYYQKYAYRTDYHFLNDIQYETSSDYQIYFWGHSLDKSDGYYINEIFDYLKDNKNIKKKIIVIYHNDEAYKRLLKNLFFIRGRVDIEERMQERSLLFCEINSKDFIKELGVLINHPTSDPMFF